MGLVKPDINTFAKIKVIGVGGGGSNAVSSMVAAKSIKESILYALIPMHRHY